MNLRSVKRYLSKYKNAWPLLYIAIYLPWFMLLEQRDIANMTDVYLIHCPLDDVIPFCEWFIIPYFLWFLYMPSIFLFLFFRSKKEFYRICAYCFLGMTICLIIYTLFPNGLDIRIDIERENLLTSWVLFLYETDTPTNVCPSIHVFGTLAAQICLYKSPHMQKTRFRRVIRKISWVVCMLICFSTIFLKQHSVIDLICGIALAIILYFIIFKWLFAPKKKNTEKYGSKQSGTTRKYSKKN